MTEGPGPPEVLVHHQSALRLEEADICHCLTMARAKKMKPKKWVKPPGRVDKEYLLLKDGGT